MIELKQTCNIKTLISDFVSKRREKQRIPLTVPDNFNVFLLTQEKDGSIIYTWEDVSMANEGAVVTHFGVYDTLKDNHQVVYTHNQRVHVASASINKEKTLLAFTTVSRDGQPGSERRPSKDKYSAYIAEVRAQNSRVFSLNLERECFLKVQFLYDERPAEKETCMLVMLHKESIGLYRIPLAKVAPGVVMKGQPKTQQIAKKFVWCQWDATNQLLYYIHYRKGPNAEKQPVLTCLQFHGHNQFDNLLDAPLNFPFVSRSRSIYVDCALHNGIPDSTMNAKVLTMPDGTFCICYQQLVFPQEKRRASPLPRTSPLLRTSPLARSTMPSPTGSDENITEINYYVCMVHHAKTLHGCVSCIPTNIVKKAVLHFSWIGDCIMVLLPGYFVNILNVGMEYEPCHHILLHNKTSGVDIQSETSVKSDANQVAGTRIAEGKADTGGEPIPALSLMAEHLIFSPDTILMSVGSNELDTILMSVGSNELELCLYEKQTGYVYSVGVNLQSLVTIFMECYMLTTRLALLHYVMFRSKNFITLRNLFLVMCNDIASPEVSSLMSEFLIGMTYAKLRYLLDRDVLQLIPFTAAESYRGQFEKAADGERLARVSYIPLNSVNIGTKTAKERIQKKGVVADDMLDCMRRNLRLMQLHKYRRFQQDTVTKTYRQMQTVEEKKPPDPENTEEEHFLPVTKLRQSPRTDLGPSMMDNFDQTYDGILGVVPHFLQGNGVTDASEKLASLTKEVLSKHLSNHLTRDVKVKVTTVSKHYISCQRKQSQLLCHLLWSLRGKQFTDMDKSELPNLLSPCTPDEYELFQLMERYSLCTQEQSYPIPQGFMSFFTTLAFRCLDIRVFMQYVNNGAIQLTGDFMSKVLTDISDTPENVKMKHYIISKLPQRLAAECYSHWNHPSAVSYTSHQLVANLLSDHTHKQQTDQTEIFMGNKRSTPIYNSRRNSSLESVTFKPLSAFLTYLDKIDQQNQHGRESPLDVLQLEEVALYHTTHETDYNMGTINY